MTSVEYSGRSDGAKTPGTLVIFDCDGVLIDSEVIVNGVHANAMTELGMPTTLDEALDMYCGMRESEMLEKIERTWKKALPSTYTETIKARVEAAYATSLRPVTGVIAALEEFPWQICVASNSPYDKLELGLTVTGLWTRFEPFIFSAASVQRPKPAPDLYLYAAERMNVSPKCCVVIEDSPLGVRAAVAADMSVLGFVGGGHCRPGLRERLLGAGASLCFDDMTELRTHVEAVRRARVE